MDNTERVIKRVDNYIRFARYGWLKREQLSRRLGLKELEKVVSFPTSETISIELDIKSTERFKKSGKFMLPLKVRGVFLKEGRPQRKYYKAKELEASTYNPENKKFPIMLDHRDKEASTIVGMVDRIEYDDSIKALKWWGHINDETFARNILDGAIKEVSVTVESITDYDDEYGTIGYDLTFTELSLVMKGAVSGNYIQVDDSDY